MEEEGGEEDTGHEERENNGEEVVIRTKYYSDFDRNVNAKKLILLSHPTKESQTATSQTP